ncbi:MAG: site-specific integrase [Nocardioides sp.]|uniref:tyrosine-type recombinase/integrase n=1 Tax=Nocardioides sp. TaxID=35761 RepID=UPI0039E2F805
MAWVEKRERTTAKGKTQITWRVRWREPDGRARAKSFPRKVDADRFAFTVSADIVRGNYLDPDAGKVKFEEYAAKWLAAQTFEETTRVAVELRLRLHAYPVLGDRFLSDIQPSTIQGWLRGLTELAPTYRKVVFANVATVFTAAVDDEILAKNPCKAPAVRKPRSDPKKLVAWTQQRVLAMRDELPDRYSLVAVLGAGLGLRQGEIFALSPDDLDLERGEVNVRRQVKVFGGNVLVFGLPKGRKTCKVPLPDGTLEAITRHMTQYPPVEVTLPWMVPDGKETTASLLLTTRERKALNRNYFNTYVWRPALVRTHIPDLRENGCHALRHFFASTALHEGETIKAVSEHLGHADPGFTLRTYTHLMEGSSERTKRAIDAVFGTHSDEEEDVEEDDDDDVRDGDPDVAADPPDDSRVDDVIEDGEALE